MNVIKEIKINQEHSIEIGKATWDEDYISIRNRYKTKKGGFSPHSSSELPLNDIQIIVSVVSNEDLLSLKSLQIMMKKILKSMIRQLVKKIFYQKNECNPI